ncbi:MAG: hydrogenase maturation nickel metallochaperone HypA [Syntrophomonadaceae bacterium]|nr:hydrogenase maturation nickel metallochaperone HypA [Syntrophomonadaceae bacterium]
MHELSVTQGLLKTVLKHTQLNEVRQVIGINLRIGEMSDIEEEWLQKYFDYLSRDTVAAGAKIRVEKSPAVFSCEECQREFVINLKDRTSFSCPACGEKKVKLIAGREFEIRELEVI